jgi:hypothetical protein
VINENTNAMNNTIRYPRNSISVPVTKNPMIMMIAKAQIPAIIICLLSIQRSLYCFVTIISLKTYPHGKSIDIYFYIKLL